MNPNNKDKLSSDENSILPDSGLTYDSFTIGSSWVDSSSYNLQDHSIESRGETYFLWTSSYEFLKLQVMQAKPIISGELYQIIFKWMKKIFLYGT